jgi:hypothetical protein
MIVPRQISAPIMRSPEQYPIDTDAPINFQPVQVVYREIMIESDGTYRYLAIDKPTKISNPGTFKIDDFVKNIIDNVYKRNAPDHEEYKYLAITISKPSYIIIEISDQLSRTYSTDEPAITVGKPVMGHPDPDDIYGELRHVDGTGHIDAKPLQNCRLAYFSAMPVMGTRKNPYVRSLNYNTEDRGGTLVIIDPDIRNPGNAES